MSLTRVDIDVCWTKNVPICYIITPWKYQVRQCGSKKLMRYWQFHIIKWKKFKVLSHLRDSRIETYLEKACYLGSLWLVGGQETQKYTKIKSAILTKMRHGKPLWFRMAYDISRMTFEWLPQPAFWVPLTKMKRVKNFWNRFNCAPAKWALEKERRREKECLHKGLYSTIRGGP